jgi:hypothetical protein
MVRFVIIQTEPRQSRTGCTGLNSLPPLLRAQDDPLSSAPAVSTAVIRALIAERQSMLSWWRFWCCDQQVAVRVADVDRRATGPSCTSRPVCSVTAVSVGVVR